MAVNKDQRYPECLRQIRTEQYPMINDTTYLDHAGTTLYARILIDRFSHDLTQNLYGNPHSASASSELSSQRIEDTRLEVLQFFRADPALYDVVFVPNATAGAKLVMDSFRAQPSGFWYGYHSDSHTSLVGVREEATLGHKCFESDADVEQWIDCNVMSDQGSYPSQSLELFEYPAQSNMNGRRLPLSWCRRVRQANNDRVRRYTLLDVAGLVSTAPLDLSDVSSAPDFTILSFYKIFGFPDLGALIVRKDSAEVLSKRSYFGGGTIDAVTTHGESWHVKKCESIHAALEDGTTPFHSIIALRHAMAVHKELFGTMQTISAHTSQLGKNLYDSLVALRHGNGRRVCEIYKDETSNYALPASQGPIVAFNMRDHYGKYISNEEVEKLATTRNIHLRSGHLCNPGGIAKALKTTPAQTRENHSAGHRCGSHGGGLIKGIPNGMLRVSLGAMSNDGDITKFIDFLHELFVEQHCSDTQECINQRSHSGNIRKKKGRSDDLVVEQLIIYPIKSCAGWNIPPSKHWKLRREGLAWDREWCLVHQGTGIVLNQKRYPKMCFLRPKIDLDVNELHVTYDTPGLSPANVRKGISVPLSRDRNSSQVINGNYDWLEQRAKVCGETIVARTYTSAMISDFFSSALDVPCHLVRFSPARQDEGTRRIETHRKSPDSHVSAQLSPPILLSNESPILVITRTSLDELNTEIKIKGGKQADAAVFRANIIVAPRLSKESKYSTDLHSRDPQLKPAPYSEDSWKYLRIRKHIFDVLGPCQRCQMVCVDQRTAKRDQEPLLTLAKTRRRDGKMWFGMHVCQREDEMFDTLLSNDEDGSDSGGDERAMVQIGDRVTAYRRD